MGLLEQSLPKSDKASPTSLLEEEFRKKEMFMYREGNKHA